MVAILMQPLQKLVRSTRHTMDGFTALWKKEQSFRLEVYLSALMIPVACLLPVASISKLVLIVCLGLLLTIEIINSAIEAVIDRISPETHPLSKIAKDMGSAAVCLAILMNLIAWIFVLSSI